MIRITKKILNISLLSLVVFFSFTTSVFAQQGVEWDPVAGPVYTAITSIGALVAKLGGNLLDASLSLFVINMVGTMELFGLLEVISYSWSLIRDMFNLIFIFGLVYIGFKIILGLDDSGAKRNLGALLIAALLINFSLYVTQVVVDFGNIAAVEIGAQFIDASDSGYEVFGLRVRDLSSSFLNASQIGTISEATLSLSTDLSSGDPSGSVKKVLGLGDALGIGLTVTLMFILIGFVFAAGAFLMITRFLTLFALMIFSPVMFLGSVLPGFKNISKDWWGKLISQTLVGPIFLFMLLVALYALQSMKDRMSTGEFSTPAFIVSSVLVAGFVWTSLLVAKKVGALGASQMINLGKGMANSVRGQTGRFFIGRTADKWNRNMEERGVNEKDWRRRITSSLASNKFGSSYSSVDARSSQEKASQKKARYEQVQKVNTSIATGHSSLPGSQQRIEMEKAVTGASNEQVIELLGKHKPGSAEYKALVRTMSAGQFEAAMKAKPEELDDKAKSDLGSARMLAMQEVLSEAAIRKAQEKDAGATLSEDEALQKGIKDASDAQLKALGVDTIVKHAADLKQSQFEDIMKSKDYTETEKMLIGEKRKEKQIERFKENAGEFLKDMKGKDIAKLPKEILTDYSAVAPHLTSDAMKSIVDEQSVTLSERREIAKAMIESNNRGAIEFMRNNPIGRQFAGEDINLPPTPTKETPVNQADSNAARRERAQAAADRNPRKKS